MKTEPMLDAFDKFTDRMAQRYAEVRVHLVAGRYDQAYRLLADMATSHAKTSVSLRNVLVRDGKLEEQK